MQNPDFFLAYFYNFWDCIWEPCETLQDVIRALNRSVKLYIPPEATYSLIQPYIREATKFAWECSALAHPLDVALATDAELFDDHK